MLLYGCNCKQVNYRKERDSRQAKNSPKKCNKMFSPIMSNRRLIIDEVNDDLEPAEASVYASFRGSLTVETAFVLPLFLLGMVMLLGMMDAVRVQLVKNMELGQRAEKLSMYAYAATSVYEADMVDLSQTYTYRLPVSLFPYPGIRLALRGRVHAWTGYEGNAALDGSDDSGEMVYVTDNESVYHTSSSCTHLDLTISQTTTGKVGSLRNEYGEKYHTCEHCHSENASGTVFIAAKGDSYHSSLGCSGLKRTVRLVKKDSVSGLHVCSRCQGAGS